MFRYISQFNTLSIILQQTYLTRSLIVQQEEDVFVTFKRQQLVMKTEAALVVSFFACYGKRRMENHARAIAFSLGMTLSTRLLPKAFSPPIIHFWFLFLLLLGQT